MSTIISSAPEADGIELLRAAVYPRAELAVREHDGVAVTLFWLRGTDIVVVSVFDKRNGEAFELVLEAHDRPLEVFHHPYAFAAARGVDTGRDARDDALEEEIVDV